MSVIEHAAVAALPVAPSWVSPGTPEYRRVSFSLFLAGFSTFALLYCVQPLLPLFARDFHVSPAASSLPVSFATVSLAVAILVAAILSERWGRRNLMIATLLVSASLNIATAFVPGWLGFLALRTIEGFALGGVPAVALAYLSEEINPAGIGTAVGLYVAGNAFGGMAGRVGTSILTELFSWRVALGTLGVIALVAGLLCVVLLPESRNFKPCQKLDWPAHWRDWRGHIHNPRFRLLFAVGFLFMGVFVTIFNYASFRLMASPYNLSPGETGLIFTVYIFGIVGAPLSGVLADRFGQRAILAGGIIVTALGIGLTLMNSLIGFVAGIAILTGGFFCSQSVASGWVGVIAGKAKGHATSLYLLAYYAGASLAGPMGGHFWASGGWPAVAGFTLVMLALALVAAVSIGRNSEA